MSPHKRILSVCYDAHLIESRTMLLQAGGYSVVEVTGHHQALVALDRSTLTCCFLTTGFHFLISKTLLLQQQAASP